MPTRLIRRKILRLSFVLLPKSSFEISLFEMYIFKSAKTPKRAKKNTIGFITMDFVLEEL
jgi:hypothetical protein